MLQRSDFVRPPPPAVEATHDVSTGRECASAGSATSDRSCLLPPDISGCNLSLSTLEEQSAALGLSMERVGRKVLSVHPSGRRIAFNASTGALRSNEVWVMENFLREAQVSDRAR